MTLKRRMLLWATGMSIASLAVEKYHANVALKAGINDAAWFSDLAGHVFAAAIALAVFAFIGADKQGSITMAGEHYKRRFEAAEVVRKCIGSALDALETISRVAEDVEAEKLPELAATSFNSLSQFCAAWIGPDESGYWEPDERKILLAANRAVFEFLLSLEANKQTDLRELAIKAEAARELLEAVRIRLKGLGK